MTYHFNLENQESSRNNTFGPASGSVSTHGTNQSPDKEKRTIIVEAKHFKIKPNKA